MKKHHRVWIILGILLMLGFLSCLGIIWIGVPVLVKVLNFILQAANKQ